MKKIIFFVTSLLYFTFQANAQVALDQKVSSYTCDCLRNYAPEEIDDEIMENCISEAMKAVAPEMTQVQIKALEQVDNMWALIENVTKQVSENCLQQSSSKDKGNTYYYSVWKKANKWYENGKTFEEIQDYTNAIKAYDKALIIDPEFVLAWDNMGFCYKQLKNYPEAIRAFKKSLILYPEGKFAQIELAEAYLLTKESDKAVEIYNGYKELFPDEAFGYLSAGNIRLGEGNYRAATEDILMAHKINILTGANSKQSKKLLLLMYKKYKDDGAEDELLEKAKEMGIELKKE
ncbi:tetratricopeptide repeat protein [Sediminitomix flava]|uniref:Tetratricopeptide repeat protein n=1 Tax=Sediminitomix flava TaxID=379075 RepID=A0A315ZE03_SEDFL|nr:tetratricopeptide repeat protein [Sediminitomix flava]PWJ43383.1 tetratricopeptide repeat protein [Sediminitomix flava]